MSVYGADEKCRIVKRDVKLPKVFAAPVRADIVKEIFELVRKNKRMAHGVSKKAGQFTSHK